MQQCVGMMGYSIWVMKSIFFLLLTTIPLFCLAQQPGFRNCTTVKQLEQHLWISYGTAKKLITTGQFLTDTAPNNALNGLLYMELDTNGNTLFTDIYFHPNDAVTSSIGNNIVAIDDQVYITSQMFNQVQENLLVTYNNSELTNTNIIYSNGFRTWLYHVVKQDNNILLSGGNQNFQYHSEGMLIKSDPMGNELWRKYFGHPGLECEIAEPYILDKNTILLPGFKIYAPDNGPVINEWTKTRILPPWTVLEIPSLKWESPKMWRMAWRPDAKNA